MRRVLLVAAVAFGLTSFAGCGESAPSKTGGGQAPPPENSGADKEAPKKGGRLPPQSK